MTILGLRRGALISLLILAGCVSTPDTQAPATTLQPVELTISNASDGSIRCVAVLAHFITRDTQVLVPGALETLEMERDQGAHALAYGTHNGAPMMVENILCGAVDDWSGTRADIPLTTLRAGDAPAYEAVCTRGDQVACTVAPTFAVN